MDMFDAITVPSREMLQRWSASLPTVRQIREARSRRSSRGGQVCRGKDGKDSRAFAFARAFARQRIRLNDAVETNRCELSRTLRRVDKLGVTGSSPVPPISSALP
jgi:hypothetical protein